MSEPALIALPDAEARAAALTPDESFIVQAPAGSGKTELLTQRYLRLLAGVQRPEQILAITFTRKAASEMRHRVLKALKDAQDTPRPDKAHEVLTWELANAACSRDREQGWALLSHPARLRIQTIDALNMSLARRLPILSGAGGDLNIAADMEPLYEIACLRLIERLGDGSAAAAHLEDLMVHIGNRVDHFTALLIELLQKREQWLNFVIENRDEQSLRARMEATLGEIICRHLTALRAAIPEGYHDELVELLTLSINNRLREAIGDADVTLLACKDLMRLPEAAAAALDAWRGIARIFLTGNREFYKTVDKRHGFPTTDKVAKERMIRLLALLRTLPDLQTLLGDVLDLPAPRYGEEQWRILRALLNVLPLAVAELNLVFQERGEVDYVETSLRALRALGPAENPTDLALAFDDRLQHILVDEFQDTSFTQKELLTRLTAGWSPGDGRSVFCVGDPMQSIYRFREAEVGLFLELQAHGLPNVPMRALKLAVNFRSTRPIVDWINQVFPRVLPSVSDAEHGAVNFSSSQAQPRAADTGAVQVHAAIDRHRAAEAREVARCVHEALSRDPRGSIAILVANRRHVGDIGATLDAEGIAFQAVEIESLRERPAVQDLLALTRALVHLGDRTAWLAVLRAPYCGLTLPDLHSLAADDGEAAVWTLMNDAAVTARLSPEGAARLARIRAVLEQALAERGRHGLRDWIERTWLALNAPATLHREQDLTDAEAFFRRLEQLDVAADLEDVARLDAEVQNLFARPRPDAQSRVEIMTIHKSKGLEFDTVILPALESRGGRDSDRLLRWARIAGLSTDGLVLAPLTARGADADPIYRWLKCWERRRSEYERGRQLYVATTRARHHLHLFGSIGASETKDGLKLRKPNEGSLLALLWPSVSEQFDAALSQHVESPPTPRASTNELLLRRLPLHWQAPAPELSVRVVDAPNYGGNIDERPEFDWAGETGRRVGTVVHRELERLVKAPRERIAAWNVEVGRKYFALELAELGVPEAFRDDAVARAVSAIEHMLEDPRGRWILGLAGEHREALAEIALSGIVNHQPVNIVIDRSFVDAEGVRWIVDFKTGSHEGGARDAFLASEVTRYRPQLALYAKLMAAYKPKEQIKTALYFPLLGEWREVS